MKMPISSLECCKKKNFMEKFSKFFSASNPYVFALYIIHPQITINIKIILKTTKNQQRMKTTQRQNKKTNKLSK